MCDRTISSNAAFNVSSHPQSLVKTVIFDFDGTIADSFDTVLKIANRLALEFGYTPARPDEIKQLQNLSSREIIQYTHVPWYKLPFILRRLKSEMNQEIGKLMPFSGIHDALTQLKLHGYPLGIVTSNTDENVRFFLEKYDLAGLFDFVRSGVPLFGKARVINQLLKAYPLGRDRVIYVGDETRDVEAARKTRIRVVAVCWGFNSKQALEEADPDALVEHPLELMEAIARLQ